MVEPHLERRLSRHLLLCTFIAYYNNNHECYNISGLCLTQPYCKTVFLINRINLKIASCILKTDLSISNRAESLIYYEILGFLVCFFRMYIFAKDTYIARTPLFIGSYYPYWKVKLRALNPLMTNHKD